MIKLNNHDNQPAVRELAGVTYSSAEQNLNNSSQIQVRPVNFSPVAQPIPVVAKPGSTVAKSIQNPAPFPSVNDKPLSKPVNEQYLYPLPNTAKDITNSCEITSINPTFNLRWVNIIDVIDNCIACKYNNIKAIPNSVHIFNRTIELVRTGVTTHDPIRKYHIFGGDYRKIAITNCKAIQLSYSRNVGNIKCHLCNQYITADHFPIGIPIKMIPLANGKLLFIMIDACCGFRHAYKHLIRETNKYATHLMSELYDAEMLLLLLFGLIYPKVSTDLLRNSGNTLKESPDPDLLDANDGSLSKNMYDNGNENYIQLGYSFPYVPNNNVDLRFTSANYMIQD